MIWYCQKFYFPQIRCTCTIIASFKPIPILVPFGHTTYFSSFLPFLCILIHSLMFTLVTRESVSKVGSRRQTGFCVCSGLFFAKLPFVSTFPNWRFETEGRVWPWAPLNPVLLAPEPPLLFQASPLFPLLSHFAGPRPIKVMMIKFLGSSLAIRFGIRIFWRFDSFFLQIKTFSGDFVLLSSSFVQVCLGSAHLR